MKISCGFFSGGRPAQNWTIVPQSKTSIVAEYFCSFGDEIWSMSDDELVQQTADHLVDDLGFVERNEVLDARHPPADRIDHVEVIGVRTQHLRAAVVREIHEIVRHEAIVERHEHGA